MHVDLRLIGLLALLGACGGPEDAPTVEEEPPAPVTGPGAEQFNWPSVDVDSETGFELKSGTIPTTPGTMIGGINALCEPADQDHTRPGGNESPQLEWSSAPEGTKSFVLLVYDPDAPVSGERANQEGVNIPKEEPRQDFFHQVLVDIPAARASIPAGASKPAEGAPTRPTTQYGLPGSNDFSTETDAHTGYDGPCPPWNDDAVHRYIFEMHALDVATLGMGERFDGRDVRAKLEGHVLATASFTSIYWLNPAISMPMPPQ